MPPNLATMRTSFVAGEGPYGDPGFLWAKWLDTLSQQEREAMERRDDMRRTLTASFRRREANRRTEDGL